MSQLVKKIMVFVDGTEQSITAAQYAICLASGTGAQLIGLYVVNTRAVEDLLKARIFLQDEQVEYQKDMEADGQRYLNYINELATKKGVTATLIWRRSSRDFRKNPPGPCGTAGPRRESCSSPDSGCGSG